MASTKRLILLKSLRSCMRVSHAMQVSGTYPCRHLSMSNQCHKSNILYSAVCVERAPVITAPKTKIEQKFADMLSQMELEESFLSDHEVRLKTEEQVAKKKQDIEDEDEVSKEGETETALDLEDKWEAEFKKFIPAPRETEADAKDDRQSIDRKLETTLYLLVKQNIEGRDHWVLPQATWELGETLRQTAERALSSVCGDIKTTILGNAPCAVAKYDPPQDEDERGIKLFFFKAWYREGDVKPNKDLAGDFLWVTKDELGEYCHNGYKKHLRKFIFDI